jgi:hypothetical protein
MILDNANPVEIGWTIVGIVATCVLLWALNFFIGRLKLAFNNDVDQATRILAIIKVIGASGGLSIQLGFVAVGIIAMLTPPVDPGRPVTTSGIIVAAAIIWCEIVLAGLAILDVLLIRWNLKNQAAEQLAEEKRLVVWADEERQERLSNGS